MAFTPKTWQGREVEHPGRIILTPTGTPNEYDVARSEGEITREGDFLGTTALNDLEQRIANGKADSDGSGNALNALSLGGVAADKYPQVSSGTWLPEVRGGTVAGTPTYASRGGIYYRVGPLVVFNLSVVLTSKGGMTGNLRIAGLPFAASYGVATFTNLGGLNLAAGETMVSGNVIGDAISPNVASQYSVSVADASKIADSFLTYGSYGYYITA